MNANLRPAAPLLAAALALLTAAPAAWADVPSFKNRGGKEKKWVEEVGTAIVRAARTAPISIEMDSYKFEDVKGRKDRKDLKITMNWKGSLSRRKFVSTIVVKIDVRDDKKWVVLDVEYEDTNTISAGKPRRNEILALVKKFNRD
jgi:hypothetical protein